MTYTSDLAEIIATNARQYRERAGATTDAVATIARECGLSTWNDSSVRTLERGDVSPSLPTLFALALTFSKLLNEDVELGDLCKGYGNVRLTESLIVPHDALERVLHGEPVNAQPGLQFRMLMQTRVMELIETAGMELLTQKGVSIPDLQRAVAQVGLAEQRAAKDLGTDPYQLALDCLIRYGRTFAEERDARAGDGANAQKRGQAARAMKDELRQRDSQDDSH